MDDDLIKIIGLILGIAMVLLACLALAVTVGSDWTTISQKVAPIAGLLVFFAVCVGAAYAYLSRR